MINISNKPAKSNSLFFGESDGISRLDMTYDSSFKKLVEVDESNEWFLNIVSCSQDRWDEMPPEGLSKFQKTTAYQTVVDCLVPDIFSSLSEISNDPWLSHLYSRISTMESTHAMSYSSGVDQAFGAKATEFLDIIYADPKIVERVELELDIAKQFIKAVRNGWENTEANHKLLLTVLASVFIVEGIKFPFSFFTSWTLSKAYGNCAQGFSQLLIKIATDEMTVHTTTGSTVLGKLRKSPDLKYLFDNGWFAEMFTNHMKEIVKRELEWAEYLLEDGEVPGFNYEICEHFLRYWADRRLRELGLPQIYNVQKNDIEIWFDEYRNINNKAAALQEIDNVSYQLNQVIDDLGRFDS